MCCTSVPPGAEGECAEQRAVPVLNSLEQIDAWTALARKRGQVLPAILQVDTGMSRLGLPPAELQTVAENPDRLRGIALRYVMSHLACAEQQDDAINAEQLRRFHAARAMLPAAPASFANSSGIFLWLRLSFRLGPSGRRPAA